MGKLSIFITRHCSSVFKQQKTRNNLKIYFMDGKLLPYNTILSAMKKNQINLNMIIQNYPQNIFLVKKKGQVQKEYFMLYSNYLKIKITRIYMHIYANTISGKIHQKHQQMIPLGRVQRTRDLGQKGDFVSFVYYLILPYLYSVFQLKHS